MELMLCYQDEYLVAVHKPAGLLVHRSDIDKHETRFLLQMLRDQLGQFVFPVHRLDKPTSGLIIFALDVNIARQLTSLFACQQISKTYQAIVRGFTEPAGDIDSPIKPTKDYKGRFKQKVLTAKPAQTQYRCLGQLELPYAVDKYPSARYSLLELKPLTGRKHQLRKHMKHISHPIIGDPKYGKSKHNRFFAEHFTSARLLLAATAVAFKHPVSNKRIHIDCAPSEDFARISTLFS